jgi:hypothetical protein
LSLLSFFGENKEEKIVLILALQVLSFQKHTKTTKLYENKTLSVWPNLSDDDDDVVVVVVFIFFLGAFAKLRKATISVVMSVRLSVHMEQLDLQWTDFY